MPGEDGQLHSGTEGVALISRHLSTEHLSRSPQQLPRTESLSFTGRERRRRSVSNLDVDEGAVLVGNLQPQLCLSLQNPVLPFPRRLLSRSSSPVPALHCSSLADRQEHVNAGYSSWVCNRKCPVYSAAQHFLSYKTSHTCCSTAMSLTYRYAHAQIFCYYRKSRKAN